MFTIINYFLEEIKYLLFIVPFALKIIPRFFVCVFVYVCMLQTIPLQCPRLLNFFLSPLHSSPPSKLSYPPTYHLPTFPNSVIVYLFFPKQSFWWASSWDSIHLQCFFRLISGHRQLHSLYWLICQYRASELLLLFFLYFL